MILSMSASAGGPWIHVQSGHRILQCRRSCINSSSGLIDSLTRTGIVENSNRVLVLLHHASKPVHMRGTGKFRAPWFQASSEETHLRWHLYRYPRLIRGRVMDGAARDGLVGCPPDELHGMWRRRTLRFVAEQIIPPSKDSVQVNANTL